MTTQANTVDLQDLLANASWVRGLAHSLVLDHHAAEDIVQDAWLAALRKPPTDARNLRGWLGRVVHNLARQRGRTRARAADREALAAGDPEPVQSPDETVGRIEAHQLLADLVLQLDEPYREALVLRFFEGLEPAEIAARLGVPGGTIRWRVSRGLELLREELERRNAGRGSWATLLAPVLRRGAAAPVKVGAAVSAAIAVVIHPASWLTAAAATALVLWGLFGSAPGVGGWGRAAEEGQPVQLAELELPAAERAAEPAAAAGPASARQPVEAPATSQSPTSAPASGVAVRLLDGAGRPLAGLEVGLYPDSGRTVVSGADGRAELGLEPTEPSGGAGAMALAILSERHRLAEDGRTMTLARVVEDPGLLLAFEVSAGERVDLGDVRLVPAGVVVGQVLDPSGQPVPGARLDVADPRKLGSAAGSEALVRSSGSWGPLAADAQGRFRIPRLAPGFQRIWAMGEGFLAVLSAPVEVVAGTETAPLVLRLGELASDDFIRGIVLDPSGEPVPRARVRVSYRSLFGSGSSTAMSGLDGRFQVAYDPRNPRTLWASDRQDRWAPAVLKDVVGGADVVLQLTEPVRAEVQLVASGRSLTEAYVQLRSADTGRPLDSLALEPGAGGVVPITLPPERFDVQVEAAGFATATVGPFEPGGLVGPIRVDLVAQAGVTGVVRAGGEPASDATVTLHAEATGRAEVEGFPTRASWQAAAEGRTAADGSFDLTLRERGRFYLRAAKPGLAPAVLGPFELDPDIGRAGLELELTPGGSLAGRVLAPEGESLAGRHVAISNGDGQPQSQVTGDDGSFLFEHLTPGPWQVQPREGALLGLGFSSSSRGFLPRNEEDFAGDCLVVEGETTHFDLDLTSGPDVPTLAGSLILDGKPASGWVARLGFDTGGAQVTGPDSPMAVLDDEGRFEVAVPEPGRYRLGIVSSSGSQISIGGVLELVPGLTTWSATLTTGSLVLTNPSPEEGPLPPEMFLATIDGIDIAAPLSAGEDGTARLDGVPVGEGRIARFGMDDLSWLVDPMGHPGLIDVRIRAGEVTEVAVP